MARTYTNRRGGDAAARQTFHSNGQRSADTQITADAQAEQFETGSKKVRGMARRSLDLIEAMYAKAEAAHPITGRGIGYKLFTAGLIPSMAKPEMRRVYRLLKEARERGDIPWGVDC
jgi:hypothetical protein